MSEGNGHTGLTLDEILAIEDRSPVFCEIPEWGLDEGKPRGVWMLPCSGSERDKFEQADAGDQGGREHLLAGCLCDADGNRFNPSPAQLMELMGKSGKTIQRMAVMAADISGYFIRDPEDLAKN